MDLNELTDAVFACAEANDWDGFRAAFTVDAVLAQNVGREQPVDEAMKSLPLLTADGTSLKYENVRRVLGDNAVTEMHDAVFTKPDGREVRLDICVVLQFDDHGKIARADEYLDSAAAAALFT